MTISDVSVIEPVNFWLLSVFERRSGWYGDRCCCVLVCVMEQPYFGHHIVLEYKGGIVNVSVNAQRCQFGVRDRKWERRN